MAACLESEPRRTAAAALMSPKRENALAFLAGAISLGIA